MAVLNPYLMFAGNAREALEAYRAVFGGELTISTFGEFGGGGDDRTPADGVMHGQLDTDLGFTLMCSDAMGEGDPANGTVCVSGDEGDILRGYFEKLAEGGTVTVPLAKQVWGDEYGQLVDRFGVDWMVNIAGAR